MDDDRALQNVPDRSPCPNLGLALGSAAGMTGMNYLEIMTLLQESATVRLFRSDSAALILTFFSRIFREQSLLVLSETQLVEQLADLLEDVPSPDSASTDEEGRQLSYYEARARQLIGRWSDHGFLRNYPDAKGEVFYELTPESEKALQWLDMLNKREFVGTESRFKDILGRMRELVEQSNADPDERIRDLEAKKQAIDREIARIRAEQTVRAYDDYQVKSRFLEIHRLAQQLLSDFREVEENFRDLTREIYQRHMELRTGKGLILRFAFDALETLKQSDQGKSFYAFWDFLLMTSGQRELQELTEEVYALMRERGIDPGDSFLRNLRSYLHQAAQKVLDSNDRMAERLSRIIVDKDPQESRALKETIARIKDLAVKLVEFKDQSSEEQPFLWLELHPELAMPMERRLSLEPEEPIFLDQPDSEDLYGEEPQVLDYLFKAFYVDKDAIRQRIEALLEQHPEWSLKDILDRYPISQGLPELFAYLSMASRQSESGIALEAGDRLLIPFDHERQRALLMPPVRFKK
ncbi:MAG: hypothetical protein CVV27_02545 [Candidatus Melainabacteria bacterium HGW-Melainabacteria-1]|nr:MAG: hypothetical protein CVV27_02545 [Candidatus Melainabacteria bacterium HGW-Melainabacteria-1]